MLKKIRCRKFNNVVILLCIDLPHLNLCIISQAMKSKQPNLISKFEF
jgi:hypothetical protein